MEKKYGYVKPVIDSSHYILGGTSSLPTDILQADGNWQPYIPQFEAQSTSTFETYGCSVYGTLSALETLIKKIYGINPLYADRFDYILAEIRAPGGDPHAVAEIIRKNGVIDYDLLPMTDTYADFIIPDPLPTNLLTEGQAWLQDKNFMHEWVYTNTPATAARIALLQQALQYSPVAISVTAWIKGPNGTYIDNGQPNCHWVACIGLELQADGRYCPIVVDSYEDPGSDDYIKKLDPDHHSDFAKRYAVTPAFTVAKKTTFLQLLKIILTAWGLLPAQTASIISTEQNIIEPTTVPVQSDTTQTQIPIKTEPAPKTYDQMTSEEKQGVITVENWATAIAHWEGSNPKLNNPGNLKYTDLTAGWGATKGTVAEDGGDFAVFQTYEMGMTALCDFLTLGCKNELLDFHNARELGSFMTVYAGKPPQGYLNGIAKEMGCSLETEVSMFLPA